MTILIAVLASVVAILLMQLLAFSPSRSIKKSNKPVLPINVDLPKEPVTFEVWWEQTVVPDTWSSIWACLCDEALGREELQAELKRRMSAAAEEPRTAAAVAEIARGTEITVIPTMDGATFNPPMARFHWLEPWHVVELRMKVAPAESPAVGRIAFYAGVVLIAEVAFVARLSAERATAPARRSAVSPYRSIFVSYAHDDAAIVDELEKAFRSLGDSYLRDVSLLRSGEEWSPALLASIKTADVFQLCWSESARRSIHVEREWRYAHGLQRAGFIRPMYWEKPMPEPPGDLAHLHFNYVPLDPRERSHG
jgi:TIR domain